MILRRFSSGRQGRLAVGKREFLQEVPYELGFPDGSASTGKGCSGSDITEDLEFSAGIQTQKNSWTRSNFPYRMSPLAVSEGKNWITCWSPRRRKTFLLNNWSNIRKAGTCFWWMWMWMYRGAGVMWRRCRQNNQKLAELWKYSLKIILWNWTSFWLGINGDQKNFFLNHFYEGNHSCSSRFTFFGGGGDGKANFV